MRKRVKEKSAEIDLIIELTMEILIGITSYFGIYKDNVGFQQSQIQDNDVKNPAYSTYLCFVKRSMILGPNKNWGYQFEILDSNLSPYNIEINGWRIASRFSTWTNWGKDKTDKKIVGGDVSDSDGETRDFSTSAYDCLSLIKEVERFSRYKTWLIYDLYKENERLKEELERIKIKD